MFKLHLKLNCLFKNKKEAKLSPKLTSNGKEWNDNDKLLRPVLGLKNKSARKILNFVRKKISSRPSARVHSLAICFDDFQA